MLIKSDWLYGQSDYSLLVVNVDNVDFMRTLIVCIGAFLPPQFMSAFLFTQPLHSHCETFFELGRPLNLYRVYNYLIPGA